MSGFYRTTSTTTILALLTAGWLTAGGPEPSRNRILKSPALFERIEPVSKSSTGTQWVSSGPAYSVRLNRGGAAIHLGRGQKGTLVQMEFLHSRHSEIVPAEQGKAVRHYLIGPDPKTWRTNVPTFRKLTQKQIYPGIDVVYYGNQ